MTVLLFILKIIGITLLLILGILLLAIALVLFHPVSYQAGGEIEEQTYVHGKISWLFRILSWRFSWDGKEFTSDFYLFGRKHKKKEGDEDIQEDDIFLENDFRDEEDDVTENDSCSGGESSQEEEYLLEEADSSKENNLKDTGSTDMTPLEQDAIRYKKDIQREKAVRSEKKRQRHKGKLGHKDKPIWVRLKEKLADAFESIRQFFQKFMDTLKDFNDKKQEVMSLLSDEANKKTVKGIFGELRYLLKHLRVRKIATDLSFSAGDPALTGQVLGGLCLVPFLYQKGVGIYPDFEAEKWYVKGNFKVEGHARGIHFVCSAIRLWKDKNLRRLIKRFRKG
ncbi:MAG: hypothetical protein PUB28_03000 [Roseburia sp.]|uniref:hypothetical protein n=1 Tax=Roseburia sp. 831b TaxID=1261635 RepID=UPI000950F25F|nr:hypothetical protein [Roseburia sp. 831b]MDD6215709.1 hypothetical protein [Roseburia sp.]WVK74014.1 hypothetical protein BIV16_05710 [Roseburia sp. 831b]